MLPGTIAKRLLKHGEFRLPFVVSTFGSQLCSAVESKEGRETIGKLIDETFFFEPQNAEFGPQMANNVKFDLQDFVRKVQSAIEKGDLKDPSGALKKSATELLSERSKLVRDFYGHGSYAKLGGVSVFLPTAWMRDPARAAEESVLSGEMAKVVDRVRETPRSKDLVNRLEKYVEYLEQDLKSPHATAETDRLIKSIRTSYATLSSADTYDKASASAREIADALSSLRKTELVKKECAAKAATLKERAQECFGRELVADGGGAWDRFRLKLVGR